MSDIFRERPADPTEEDRQSVHIDAQSLSFYADISAFFREHLGTGTRSLLDIGPRSGSGLALLRMLHHPHSYASIKFDPVTGIDLDPEFKATSEVLYPDIQALHGDGFEIDGKWDVVMSSHTIEHVDDPRLFLQKLTSIARQYVLVACPYEEEDLIVHHRNRITYKMLTEAGFWTIKAYRSDHWFNSMCCIAGKFVG